MTGQILSYDSGALCGVVSASDGKRYDFIAAEVKGDKSEIVRGAMVDFMLDDQGNMLEIYVIQAVQAQTPTTAQPTHAPNHAMEYSDGDSNAEWFKSLFSFRGCYTRKQYWKILIGVIIFQIVFSLILSLFFPHRSGVLSGISDLLSRLSIQFLVSLPVLWIMIATSVKRFHDINKSGAWWFFNFIPIIGNLVVFIMNGFVGSVREGNRYSFNDNATSYRPDTQAVDLAKVTTQTTRQEERIDLEVIYNLIKTFLTNKDNIAMFKKFMTNKKNIAIFILLLSLYIPYYFVNAYIDEHYSIEGYQQIDNASDDIVYSEVLKNTKQSTKLTYVVYYDNGSKAYSVEYKNPSYFRKQTSYFVDHPEPTECEETSDINRSLQMIVPFVEGNSYWMRNSYGHNTIVWISDDSSQQVRHNCSEELGVRDGVFKKWSENGALLIEANYVNGKLKGDLKYWEENGTLNYHTIME